MPKPSPKTNKIEEKSNHFDVEFTDELVDSAGIYRDEFKEIVAPTNTTEENRDDLLNDDVL